VADTIISAGERALRPARNKRQRHGENLCDIAIDEMLATVDEAMSQAINWWGDKPPPMQEAIEQFRTQLGAAIDSVEFVRRALDRQVHDTDHGKGPA